jgi:hypothetical protein
MQNLNREGACGPTPTFFRRIFLKWLRMFTVVKPKCAFFVMLLFEKRRIFSSISEGACLFDQKV